MIIYIVECIVNGKVYVGQTSKGIQHRWQRHVRSAMINGDTLFCRAIRKHGPEAFKPELLERCESLQQANEREIHWIRVLNAFGEGGYNTTEGGGGCAGYIHSKVTKHRISEALKGRTFSERHRQNLSRAHTGRRHTEEAKQRCRLAAQQRTCPSGCTCGRHKQRQVQHLLMSNDVDHANILHENGLTWAQVAKRLNVSGSTLMRARKRYKNVDSTA